MTRHTCAGAHLSAWYSCGVQDSACRHTARAAAFLYCPGSWAWLTAQSHSLTETQASEPPAWWVGSLAPGAAAAAMDAGTADLARRRWGGPTSDVSNI